jgi:Bacterial regulatory helix-turn-helix protein, lysR family
MTMPVMEPNLDAATLKAWARGIDDGPFSSSPRKREVPPVLGIERIAFDNPECLTSLGALSAWTDRVRLVTTVVVPQLHDPVMQSAVSRQVAALEGEAGSPLFERRAGGVRLTKEGLILLRHARVILDEIAPAERELEGEDRRTARARHGCPRREHTCGCRTRDRPFRRPQRGEYCRTRRG